MPFWQRLKKKLDAGGFIMAVEKGDAFAARVFLEDSGADPNATIRRGDRYGIIEAGTTVLMYAAGFGHTDVVRLLLDYGAEPNRQDVRGGTALMLAAFNGERDVVALLAERGAKLDTMSENGATALRLADAKGHKSVAALLRQLGATDYGGTPI